MYILYTFCSEIACLNCNLNIVLILVSFCSNEKTCLLSNFSLNLTYTKKLNYIIIHVPDW